jgi:hypothetical protein
MKSVILFTGSGPILVTTSFQSFDDEKFLHNLAMKGIEKCIGFEVPTDTVHARYGNHFDMVCQDLSESDDLRVIDIDGSRIFALFEFSEYGPPMFIRVPQAAITI